MNTLWTPRRQAPKVFRLDVLPRLDTKAYLLREENRNADMRGMRRLQRIWVAVGENYALYEEDLGPSERFEADPFNVASGIGDDPPMHWAYSVGEIREIADYLREGEPLSKEQEPSDLMGDYAKGLEEMRAALLHRSVSGPLVTIERR